MSCKIQKNKDGKINKVVDSTGLFQQIFNTPTLSLEESIEVFKNVYESEETTLQYETPTGESFNTYQEALKVTDEGKIKLKVGDKIIAEVDSDTSVDTFNGTINHLVKQGGLTGERILDVNGDIIYVTEGKTETAKHLTSELVEKQAKRLLGITGVINTKTGDFILKDTLNKVTINGQEYSEKEISDLNYDQLVKKFGKEKALDIEMRREYIKALAPTKTKKRLEQIEEVKTEDELVVAVKSLLSKLGVKITSIEDYVKHNTLKNNGVAPEASALMDIVNKVIAFRGGTITREDLIEETMHLIEASIDPKLTEGVRRNISKTKEWKQYSEHYQKIYSKEYSGEKLDEMVRREILGKVMANAVLTNFTLDNTSTLTDKSIFDKIRELLQQFFNNVEAFFKPEYQKQIDSLNDEIYAKLMSGTLSEAVDLDQNFGTKFRLYSTSSNINNDIVKLQKEAEKALDILRNNTEQIGKEDPSQSYTIKVARDLLKKVDDAIKRGDDKESRVETIATLAKIVNIVQRQTRYLERASKKAIQNKYPFSAEEMIVYNNLVNEFYKTIIPTVEDILKKTVKLTNSEIRIQEELNKTKEDISSLIGNVQNNGFKASDYVVDLLVNRLGLDKEAEDFLRERAQGQQEEANWFFMQFGNLSHSSNTYLNALGHVITKVDGDKREGFQKDIKPFIEKLKKTGYLEGKELSNFAEGNYLQSVHEMTKIDQARAKKEYELYYKLLDKQTKSKNEKVSLEDFNKVDALDNLDAQSSIEYRKQMDEWEIKEYKLSPLNISAMMEKREKLKDYSQVTQNYERNVSARYASIMQQAEIVEGIPLISEDMRYEFQDLKKSREEEKNLFDREGILKQGITIVNEGEPGAVQIGNKSFVNLSPSASEEAILAVELNQIDFSRIKDNEGKSKSGMTDSFRNMLSKLDSDQAYDFLMLNSYIGYTEEYYQSFNRTSVIDKLEEVITEDNRDDIEDIIEKMTSARSQINSILKANKMMNNPSEVLFDRMERYEINIVKELSQSLEDYYSRARRYLAREQEAEETETETIPNQAFSDYLFDSRKITKLIYEDEQDLDNINKVFNVVEENTTVSKRGEISSLRNDLKRFKNGGVNKFSNVHKRVFKLEIEQYNAMEEEERFAYMTNELLTYSFTKLLPYFRKTQPTGVDLAIQDLRAGLLSSSDFLNNYDNGQYEFLNITPNYNFQEATQDNNKNPHFQNAKVNFTPLFRVFEENATLEDVKSKSVEQLKKEGKLNKYANTEFLKEYDINLVELFTTGKEIARKNTNKFEARQALIDLQKISLEKNKVLGRHNLYLLPQKEASKTRKFDNYLKSGKDLKTIFEEMTNFRQDEAELGQDAGKAKSVKSDGNYSVPKYGLRELKDAPVTDDLLESYTWMNYKANEHEARKNNISDAIAINEALMGSEFEGGIDIKSSNTYKTFKESYDYNFFGVKEVWSKQFKLFGIQMDYAKMLKNFGWLIRLRNLGFTLISPITSSTTGSIFLRIESLVGEIVDKDALKKANSYFAKNAGDATREILGLQSKATLNTLGELWGWYDPMERFNNPMYSKTLRGLQTSAFAAHTMANFPINTRVGLAVLANSRFVEGELLEYRQFSKLKKGKSEKEIRAEWANYTSVLDVVQSKEDGTITYDFKKVAEALNNNFTEQEAEKFIDDKRTVIRGRIKSAIQNVDGQISTEDKSMSTRNAFFSFMNIHRSWLMIAVQNKVKQRQLNTVTGYIEEGSYRRVLRYVNTDIIKELRSSGVAKTLKKIRSEYKEYDDVTKQALKRTLWELSTLTTLVGLTLLGMKELEDDDDDSWMFKVGALFLFRTTNEVASSTVALPKSVYDVLDTMVVGLNTLEIAFDSPDLIWSDEITRGRYKGLTKRQRYFMKHMPIMRDYNNLFRDIDSTIKSYNFYNFTEGKNLNWLPTYYALDSVISEDKE